jgi:hypothetical protein
LKKQSTGLSTTPSVQTIVLAATAWALLALMVFLLFSVPLPGKGRPEWYGAATYILENFAFLGAGLLCLRNWRSPQILSGRSVWLAFSLGMFSYFVANLLLAYWEIGLGQEPAVSPGDFFFILSYLFLGWGMVQAVLSRQLNLSGMQWLTLGLIAAVGIGLAYFLSVSAPSEEELAVDTPAAIEQPVSPAPGAGSPAPAAVAPAAGSPAIAEPAEPEKPIPGWAASLNALLEPLADIVGWLYVIGDIILVLSAATLLMAFWGGRFSQSWLFIAMAAFSYYIADMWFNYATQYIPNYTTGALPEVFWIFCGCLFAIGAALEYGLSTRSRSTRRKRAI